MKMRRLLLLLLSAGGVLPMPLPAASIQYEYDERHELTGVARGGPNLYAFCRNNPVNNYDPNGCAYFAYRPLNNPITQKFGVRWRGLDGRNWVLAHEQLIFEDGGEPVNIGYFDTCKPSLDEFCYQNQYTELPGRYDDCVMREAVNNVKARPYVFFALDGSQYNCQDYAEALRKEYFRLLSDRKIWCKCGLNKKRGRR